MARVLFQELDARMGHANSTVGRPQAAAGVIAREMGMNVTRLSLRKFSSSAGVKVETLERLPSGESAWFNIMVGIAHLAQEVIDGPPSFPSTNQFQYKQQVIRKAKLDKDAYRAAVLINADRLHLADFEEEAKPRNIINYALRAAVRILDAHQEEVGALAKALRKEKTLDADRIRDILAPWTPTTPQGGAS